MRWSVAQATFYQAMLAWRQNDDDEMRARLDEAFPIFGEWHDLIGVGVCHLSYGVLERMHDNLAEAELHFADAMALHEMVGYEWGMATGRYYAAEVARDRGETRTSAQHLRDGLALYWRQGDCWGAGACTGSLATLAAMRGHWLIAARLYGASDALCQRVGALLPPTELRAYEQVAAATRSQLGDALYRKVFTEGQRLSPQQCVELAALAASGLLGESMEAPWTDEANEATRALATLATLTPKRREILRLIVQGHEIKEIAHQLGRDYNTVDGQLKVIQRAFGVETRTDLIVFIYRHGLADLI
jgi:DNA-binding CsgD family transcriptional regulator